MKSRSGSLATSPVVRLPAARAAALTLLAISLAFAAPGCRSPHVAKAPVEPLAMTQYEPDPADVAPPWLAEPLSWEKLNKVEEWAKTQGPRAAPLWRVEAQLVLGLGRLEFARRDGQSKPTAKEAAELDARVRAARASLESVVVDNDATAAQRRRAEDGLRRAERLSGGTYAKAKQTSGMGVPVIARAQWGAARAMVERMDRAQGEYSRITVHHSADPNPVPLDGSSARTFEAVREIQKAHMNGKTTHYGDIGYHFVIDPYGRVLEGRELIYQGAHAHGQNNVQNIGICLIGNFDKTVPTKAALDALEKEIEALRKRYNIPKRRVYGHRELRSTDCPGAHVMHWLESYRKS
ncbi:MAG: N-acetylmuramoyl-L-alanine amidase [Planctomycetes bacterium]|nr:N-acetylmuramoyl-L-alanine amidase [Planctomycetota bacterium]